MVGNFFKFVGEYCKKFENRLVVYMIVVVWKVFEF